MLHIEDIKKRLWLWRLRLGYVRIGGTRIKVGFGVSSEMIDSIHPDLELRERRLAQKIPDKYPIIELGAGIGVITADINKSLSTGIKHIAIEADPELMPVLENTRDLNDLSVQLLNLAYNPDEETVSVKRNGGYQWTETTENNNGIEVDSVSFAELCDRIGLDEVVLVADIEGAEIGFLEEWSTIESKCVAVMIEFHQGTEELKKRFESSDVFVERSRMGEVRYYEKESIYEDW